MNLYLRLCFLLLKLPFMHRDTDLLAPTQLKMHVLPNDLDFNFHMNNGRYLTMMDLGRFHLMAKKGLLAKVFKSKWQPVLGGIKMHFVKALGPFAAFELRTEVIYWDEKWIYIEQSFIKDDTLMATALVKALFVHKGKRILPTQLFKLLEAPLPAVPTCPTHLQHWLTAEQHSKTAREN